MKFNGWTIGVIGMAAAAAVSLSGSPSQAQEKGKGAAATGAGTTGANPGFRAEVIVPDGASIGSTGSWVFSSGGDQVKIQTRDGAIVAAEHNGKPVAPERVTMADGSVTITDESGKVVFEHAGPRIVGGPDVPRLRLFGGRGGLLGPGVGAFGGSWAGAPEPIEPPRVMMGVTMAEPEYGLRKHCGIEQRTGTMVNEVYKGMAADRAGIQPYDVIVEIEGKSPATTDVVREVLASSQPGDEVSMTVLHRCEPKKVTVKLEAYDAEKLDQARHEQMKAAGIEPTDVFAILADRAMSGTPGPGDLQALIGRLNARHAGPGGKNELLLVDPGSGAAATEQHELLQETLKQAQEAQRQAEERRTQAEERSKRLEERLNRLEALLEKLVDDKEKTGAKP